jgi:predicted nucleotidyltransferase
MRLAQTLGEVGRTATAAEATESAEQAHGLRRKRGLSLWPSGSEVFPRRQPEAHFCAIMAGMNRDAAIVRLRAHEAELRRLGVQHLYLFGSTARNEAGADSDVDLFFGYERGKFGLYELMDVKDAAAQILGCKADIMTRDSLHRTLRQKIEANALQVF